MESNQIGMAQRIVIKVGTSTLTYHTGRVNLRRIDALARVISDLRHEGREVVLVSSGAIGVGMSRLGLTERPSEVKERQASSAVGQSELMSMYAKMFGEYGCQVAQILLTKNVLEDEKRRKNAENTFHTLLEWEVIPIVNENDVISTEEIEFGDNDALSAVVAELVGAELLIILTDIDGLYNADPRVEEGAQLLHAVHHISDELIEAAGGAGSSRGTGGMATKIAAARHVTACGIPMVIANGKNPSVIYEILEGKPIGTIFYAQGRS